MTSTDTKPILRLTLFAALVGALLVALVSRLWFLQVLAGDHYANLAESNRVRVLVLEAPRGSLLAADGEELVRNRPAQTISAHPGQLLDAANAPRDEQAAAVLERLSQLLALDRDTIIQRLTSRRYSPFRPVPIAEDVAPEIIFAVRERQELFPGVVAETLPVRTYPHGTAASHLLGYLGEISPDELDSDEYLGYRPGDLVGRYGLEATYEEQLRGVEGLRKLEVNARGTVLGLLGEQEPARGHDLMTSIDLELQVAVERILEDGIVASRSIVRKDGRSLPSTAGSAVVLDPRDGSVVAMASYPTFDPAEFVGGVTSTYWEFLQDPGNQYPLLNRAIQSAHPPGSTFKVVSGAAALEAGLISPSGTLPCPGSWRLGNITFRNWNPRHEGRLDLIGALRRSCDTYFYELASQQWSREQRQAAGGGEVDEVLPRIAGAFGLGRQLGIDLPSERSGVIPGLAWRQSYWAEHKDIYCRKAQELPPGHARDINQDLCLYGGSWRGGDAVNTSIGQGDVLTTPLQLAAAYAAVGNGGTLWRPHIGKQILASDGTVVEVIEPEALDDLPLDDSQIRAIQTGLEQVVMHARGTARGAFLGFPVDEIPVAGKTGTAELRPKVPFAWFVAYAPADDPQYVVVVNVEEGGGGSQTAAPIARRILEAAFGLEITPFQAGPDIAD